MNVSASQIEVARLCRRKRWFQSIKKMPVFQSGAQSLGEILHEVAARYLLADSLGRNKSGNPVDLYPEGWAGSLGIPEQILIKHLIDRGIGEGLLQRQLDQRIEQHFHETIDGVIHVNGYVDVFMPAEIQDHKTTKDLKYAKTPEKLAQDPQMMMYARWCLMVADQQGRPHPRTIKLRHNVFVTSSGRVKLIETEVTSHQVLSYWGNKMLPEIQQLYQDSTVEKWFELPDPDPELAACVKYGGCPFTGICTQVESPEQYVARIDPVVANQKKQLKTKNATPNTINLMSQPNIFSDRLAAMGKGRPSMNQTSQPTPINPPPAPLSQPQVEERPAVRPAPPQASLPSASGQTPPWANPECTACGGKGFSSVKKPCRICDSWASKNGQKSSADFVIDTDAGGELIWEEKFVKPPAPPPQQLKVERIEPEKQALPLQPQRTDLPRTTVEKIEERARMHEEPEEEGEQEASGKKRGRPKAGMNLFIGCSPAKGMAREQVQIEDVLLYYGNQLAAREEKQSYFELQAFARRDMLASVAKQIAEENTNKNVIAFGKSPDIDALLAALRPFATNVVEGARW